jgi:phosphopantetheinyl transferase
MDSALSIYRVPSGPRGASARATVRTFLSEELRQIAGQPVILRETTGSPEIVGLIKNRKISISISYAREEAWLALGWDVPIGIDAVEISAIPEWELLASTYLGVRTLERLRTSPRREEDFAMEWAGLEARIKMHGLSLLEGVNAPAANLCEARFENVVVAVAVACGRRHCIAGSDKNRGGPKTCFAP